MTAGGGVGSLLAKIAAGVAVVLIAAYTYFAVTYQNANWVFSPPNVLKYEGRTYKPSNIDPLETLPEPRRDYEYAQVASLRPFNNPIYGLDEAPGQMNLYLEWDGAYRAYGIVGGPP